MAFQFNAPPRRVEADAEEAPLVFQPLAPPGMLSFQSQAPRLPDEGPSSLGTALVPVAEPEPLKRAREEEEERFNAKRRKIAYGEREDESLKRELQTWSNAQLERATWDYMTLLPFQTPAFHKSALAHVKEEQKRRRDAVNPEDETKRFIAEIQSMPLGTRMIGLTDDRFVFAEATNGIAGLQTPEKLRLYLNKHDYLHLDAETASLLPQYEARLQELEALKDDMQDRSESVTQREIEEEKRRFRRELKTLDLTDWERTPYFKLAHYLRGHDYKLLHEMRAYTFPEFRAKMAAYLRPLLTVALSLSADGWLRERLERSQMHFHPLVSSFTDFLGRDYIMQAIRAEFDRRGLRQTRRDRPVTAVEHKREDEAGGNPEPAPPPDIDPVVARLQQHADDLEDRPLTLPDLFAPDDDEPLAGKFGKLSIRPTRHRLG